MTASGMRTNKLSRMRWSVQVRLLTNPFVFIDLCKAFGGGVLVVYLLMIGLEWWDGRLASAFGQLTLFFGLMFFGFMLLAEMIMLVVYRNRYGVVITLDARHALFESGRVNRKTAMTISRLAVLIGGLASSPGTVGAGILAASTSRSIPWKQVVKVTEHPRFLTITLSNFWRPVIRVFCPDKATYDQALAFIHDHVGQR